VVQEWINQHVILCRIAYDVDLVRELVGIPPLSMRGLAEHQVCPNPFPHKVLDLRLVLRKGKRLGEKKRGI